MNRQVASAVCMVRPSGIDFNVATAADNHFQNRLSNTAIERIRELAMSEFEAMVHGLENAGISVFPVDPPSVSNVPDAVFPNNWISFHNDGRVVLYPMLTSNRRRERNRELVDTLRERGGFIVDSFVDLTDLENQGRIVEGTGSMVLDRQRKIAYAATSNRTDPQAVEAFCDALGYRSFLFQAAQLVSGQSVPIYHTNVLMCLGESFVTICLDVVTDPAQRTKLENQFRETEKEVIRIDENQMKQFAGNMLQLCNSSNQNFVVMSSSAYHSLRDDQRNQLARHGALLHFPIPTIEACGGGSVRCMLAEIFLPRVSA